jgi:ubiquitin-conjugating enzyme E2 O
MRSSGAPKKVSSIGEGSIHNFESNLTRNESRLYSEKAYVLSRGFVRRALEIPFGGLELEIHWIYFINKLLRKVILDARLLIDKSKSPANGPEHHSDLAVPRLTAGGIITLERTIIKLQEILDTYGHTSA